MKQYPSTQTAVRRLSNSPEPISGKPEAGRFPGRNPALTASFLVLSLLIVHPVFAGVPRAEVRTLQEMLSIRGFDPGPLDGVIGPRTEEALKRFQEANGLTASGKQDPATRAALGLQLVEPAKKTEEKRPAGASGEKPMVQSIESAAQTGQTPHQTDRIAQTETESPLLPGETGIEKMDEAAPDAPSVAVQPAPEADRPRSAAPQPSIVEGKLNITWSGCLRIFLLISLGLCALGLGGWLVLTLIGIFLAAFVAETTGWRWPLSFPVGFTVVYALPLLLGIAWKNFGGILLFLLLLGAPSFILSRYGLDSSWILAASDGIAVMNLVPVSFRRMIAGKNAFGVQRKDWPTLKNRK